MDKIVVITGASSGIGLALKEQFEAAGDTVVSCQRTNNNNDKHFICCDVTVEASVKAAAREIESRYGKIDIVINNAGVGISGATELIPMSDIRRAMDISYFGSLMFTRETLPLLKGNGRIVFMSSVSGLFALPYRSVYCSVKAAQLMLGESLRMELSHTKIKVVTLCPGEIKTNFSANKLACPATNELYGDRVAKAADYVASREEKRMPMASVAKKMYKMCDRGRKAMYIIGGKYKFLWFGKRVLPTTAYLNLTDKMLGGR